MPQYKYLIVGGGMTADAAIGGIRQGDARGTTGLIGAEPHPPYNRPPLSKGLWKGASVDTIWRHTNGQGVDFHLGRSVEGLDVRQKQAADDRGVTYAWEKLLLATGGRPRRFSFGGDQIIYYRLLDDYTHLRALTERGQRFAVIGAGFIGSEIAAALAMNKKEVVMLFPGEGIGGSLYPADLSAFLNNFYRQKGVDVRGGMRVVGIEERGTQHLLKTQSGQTFFVDGVIAGLGIQPNVALAQAAGLETDGGIVVDEMLRTSHPDIYAAGDVAFFYNPS